MAPQSEVLVSQPAPHLRPYVCRYLGYRMSGFAPALHSSLPSRNLTIILSLDAPLDLVVPPDRTQPVSPAPGLICGLHTKAALFKHDGDEHAVAVELTPLAARAVLGLPAIELSNLMVAPDDLFGRSGAQLIERLMSAPDWQARFATLDGFLTSRLRERPPAVPAEVAEAWRRLAGDPPAADVSRLADELGWSRRHLTARFRQEVGLPPRQLRRVFRLERSCRLLRAGRPRTMTELAVRSGFYDHAHMLHEWQDLADCAPSQWLGEEIPSITYRGRSG